MRDFRFSCNVFGITTGDQFAAECREAEDADAGGARRRVPQGPAQPHAGQL